MFLIILPFVGERRGVWPLIQWPMYVDGDKLFPPDTTHAYELVVTSPNGQPIDVDFYTLMPTNRDGIARRILKEAFPNRWLPAEADVDWMDWQPGEREMRYRAAFAAMVQHAADHKPVERIELWRLHWDVEQLAFVPLDRDQPVRRELVGSIVVDDLSGEKR